jgi:hypothetical protein
MILRALCVAVVVWSVGFAGNNAWADPSWTAVGQSTMKTRTDRMASLVRLLTREGVPTEQEVRKVGKDVDSLLATVVNDPNTSQYLRVKAIWCMRYFRNRRSQLLLRSVVTDPVWQKPFRVVGMVSLAHVHGAGSFEMLKDFCLDADAEVRMACVEAMDVVGGTDVVSYLQALIPRERDMSVLQRMDKVIRRHSGMPMMME